MTRPEAAEHWMAPAGSAVSGLIRGTLQRQWPWLAALGGGYLLLESVHGPLSSLLSLTAAGAGLLLLGGRQKSPVQQKPRSTAAWLERCEQVLASFDRLSGALDQAPDRFKQDQQLRHEQLDRLQQRSLDPHLSLALVGTDPWTEAEQGALLAHCPSVRPLRLHRSHPLPVATDLWHWPEAFRYCDLVVYKVSLPLKAVDLRWLEALPEQQGLCLLVERPEVADWRLSLEQLQQQLPERLRQHCLPWNPAHAEQLASDLLPLAKVIAELGPQASERNQQRCLEDLHASWQLELEQLRRQHWQMLVQRTQWSVAAGVVVAPLPSLDLVVLAAANGLMLQEMARLWDCPWSLEQLQAAAAQLAKAALSLGVIEWSSQALGSLIKLHGATWLVGGAMQALSAAYLTRVVGRAMADYMALAAGVPEQELEALLQRQAPLLVARAAEEERLDWAQFLQTARSWLQAQSALQA
ncbi:MAG: YcjF family protein [Vulcanococcus sp.]